ncbi:cation:proton antiporter [candidate division WOR-3 bacterium]|nr:cation:proton antiporter [candidate division WOR-3 bacterium]
MHHPSSIVGLAVLIIIGYAGAKMLRKVHLPAVTSYLLLGIIIGPHLCDIIPSKVLGLSGIVSHFVLGIIAFTLGESFSIKDLRTAGSSVIWISIFEAACAWLVVTGIMLGYHVLRGLSVHPAFILGAAASATAPAATVMVIREYRAHGPVTNMLLRVVAIDDAWCLILSAAAITIASALTSGSVNIRTFFAIIAELVLSVSFGAAAGFGLHYASMFIRNREEFVTVTLGFVMLLVGISLAFHLSPLLTCMVAGICIANVSRNSTLFFETIRGVDTPFFLIFFMLVGANLEIGILPKIGLMGGLYLVFRVVGKFIGVGIGAAISRADAAVRKYLAWGLVPQAGVALGVALTAKTMYPKYGGMIFTTITATTVVYELIGPLCVRLGLRKAGEI